VAKRIEDLNPFWYEEPVSARNLDALAEVRRTINLPVVTGIDDREKLFCSIGRQGWHALDELPKYPNTTEVFIGAVCGYPSTLSIYEEYLHAEDGLAATKVIEAAIESAKLGKPVVVQ